MTDKVVAHWVQKLSKFYWSPDHPTTYQIEHPQTGEKVGIGRVALNNPGSFNLTWVFVQGKLSTYQDHLTAVKFYSKLLKLNAHNIEGATLEEWCTVYDESEYREWYKGVASRLPAEVKVMHDLALITHEVR